MREVLPIVVGSRGALVGRAGQLQHVAVCLLGVVCVELVRRRRGRALVLQEHGAHCARVELAAAVAARVGDVGAFRGVRREDGVDCRWRVALG